MKNIKKVKAWIATDAKGEAYLWLEGRYAVYKSTHGKDVSLQRSKHIDNFILRPCEITYQINPKRKKK